ncbi:MAG: hypothetical protein U1E51_16570 [Candidatus Binatia bacterium]|nr:hypothetical protein [Candidatus Binatia bacterium]
MKNLKTSLSVLLITGSLGASGAAFGDDGVLVKEPVSRESNYCHLKFPAIHEDTLASRRPVLKDPQSGDIVDFYGPCDENPLGPNQIVSQKLQQENRWQSETGE